MKLFYTQAEFPLCAVVSPIDDGWLLQYVRPDGSLFGGSRITEAFIRERCGTRELSDASSIYLETTESLGMISRVYNKMVQSAFTKSNGFEYIKKNSVLVAAQLYIPFADSPFSDWSIRVNSNFDVGMVMPENTQKIGATHADLKAFPDSVFPSIRIVSVVPSAGGCMDIAAQLVWRGEDCRKQGVRVFAAAPCGYLNKREARTDADGRITFRAQRLGLDNSDEMRVELGFKFWMNLTNADIPHS